MNLFNEYGVPSKEILEVDAKIASIVQEFLDKIVKEGATPIEVRAVESMLSLSISCSVSEKILKMAFVKRQEAKVQKLLKTEIVLNLDRT